MQPEGNFKKNPGEKKVSHGDIFNQAAHISHINVA